MNQNDCSGKTLKLWPVFVDHYSLIFEEVRQQMEVALSSNQSKTSPTNDTIQGGVTGVGSNATQGAASTSTLDGLKKSWTNLKTAVGETTSEVTGSISAGFTSAVKTVQEPLLKATTSATNSATSLVNLIKGAIT